MEVGLASGLSRASKTSWLLAGRRGLRQGTGELRCVTISIRTLIEDDYRADIRFHGSPQRRVPPVKMLVGIAFNSVPDSGGRYAVYLRPLVIA